jgi:hypothetical protein
MSDKDKDAPMIKSAIGRAMPETISRNLFKKLGNFKLKKEKIIPTNAEMTIGFNKMFLSIFINDVIFFSYRNKYWRIKTDNMNCGMIIKGAKKLAILRPLFPKE